MNKGSNDLRENDKNLSGKMAKWAYSSEILYKKTLWINLECRFLSSNRFTFEFLLKNGFWIYSILKLFFNKLIQGWMINLNRFVNWIKDEPSINKRWKVILWINSWTDSTKPWIKSKLIWSQKYTMVFEKRTSQEFWNILNRFMSQFIMP